MFSSTRVLLHTSGPPHPTAEARPGPSAKLFWRATPLKSPGFKLLEDQSTNTAVIISYCPMNASFIRERLWYSTFVTAGPLGTHHMILFAIPMWKNTFSSAGWQGKAWTDIMSWKHLKLSKYFDTPPKPQESHPFPTCITLKVPECHGRITTKSILAPNDISRLSSWGQPPIYRAAFFLSLISHVPNDSVMKPWPLHTPFEVTSEGCAELIWKPWEAFILEYQKQPCRVGGVFNPQAADKQPRVHRRAPGKKRSVLTCKHDARSQRHFGVWEKRSH